MQPIETLFVFADSGTHVALASAFLVGASDAVKRRALAHQMIQEFAGHSSEMVPT